MNVIYKSKKPVYALYYLNAHLKLHRHYTNCYSLLFIVDQESKTVNLST